MEDITQALMPGKVVGMTQSTALLVLASVVGVSAEGVRGAMETAPPAPMQWSAVASPIGTTLLDVEVADGRGWAVGAAGAALRLRDDQWLPTVTGTDVSLHAVDGTADEAWAIGSEATLLHWTSDAWTIESGPPGIQSLIDVKQVRVDEIVLLAMREMDRLVLLRGSPHRDWETLALWWPWDSFDAEAVEAVEEEWTVVGGVRDEDLSGYGIVAQRCSVVEGCRLKLKSGVGAAAGALVALDSYGAKAQGNHTVAVGEAGTAYIWSEFPEQEESRLIASDPMRSIGNLNGVAVSEIDSVWAVGDDGQVLWLQVSDRPHWRAVAVPGVTQDLHAVSIDTMDRSGWIVGDDGAMLRGRGWRRLWFPVVSVD